MIPVAIAAPLAKELVGLLRALIESPETYKRLDGLRAIVAKVTGKEIDQASFLAFLEETTQGSPYTGEWESLAVFESGRRLRVEGGWIYDLGGNPLYVQDK